MGKATRWVRSRAAAASKTTMWRSTTWARTMIFASSATGKNKKIKIRLMSTLSMALPSTCSTIHSRLMAVMAPLSCGTRTPRVNTSRPRSSPRPSPPPRSRRTASCWPTRSATTGAWASSTRRPSRFRRRSSCDRPTSKRRSSSRRGADEAHRAREPRG